MTQHEEDVKGIRDWIRKQEDERGCYILEYSTTVITRVLDRLEKYGKALKIYAELDENSSIAREALEEE